MRETREENGEQKGTRLTLRCEKGGERGMMDVKSQLLTEEEGTPKTDVLCSVLFRRLLSHLLSSPLFHLLSTCLLFY